MYWSHRNEEKKTYLIEQSALNGDNRKILLNCNETAKSLTLDFLTNRLYFVNAERSSIWYFDLNTEEVSEKLPIFHIRKLASGHCFVFYIANRFMKSLRMKKLLKNNERLQVSQFTRTISIIQMHMIMQLGNVIRIFVQIVRF